MLFGVSCGAVVCCVVYGVSSVVCGISYKVCGVVCYLVWYLSNTIVVSGLLRFLRCDVRVWCAA